MINLYFGINFFYVPSEHTRMMQQLKHEIEKWKCYPVVGEILIPCNGDFTTTLWYNKRSYESFVRSAQVLIVDTTYSSWIHEKVKRLLVGYNILLVECRKVTHPRSCGELNPDDTREYLLTLEYQNSIMEVRSHILSKICLHHANLNLIKSPL